MPLHDAALITQTAAAFFMTGLIWFVQVVHYPMFRHVGAEHFADYERIHQSRTTWVVAPVMLIEAIAATITLLSLPSIEQAGQSADRAMLWIASLLLIATWGSTACIQVPCHKALQTEFNDDTHARLVRSNWIRTIAWSVRAGLLTLLLF